MEKLTKEQKIKSIEEILNFYNHLRTVEDTPRVLRQIILYEKSYYNLTGREYKL